MWKVSAMYDLKGAVAPKTCEGLTAGFCFDCGWSMHVISFLTVSYSKLNQRTTAFVLKRGFWKKSYVYVRNSAVQLNQSQNVPIKMKTILCMQMRQKTPSLHNFCFPSQ